MMWCRERIFEMMKVAGKAQVYFGISFILKGCD